MNKIKEILKHFEDQGIKLPFIKIYEDGSSTILCNDIVASFKNEEELNKFYEEMIEKNKLEDVK